MRNKNHYQLLQREFWYFAGFLIFTIIQELVILVTLTGNPGFLILLNLLMLILIFFILYYSCMLIPFPWILIAIYLAYKGYLFAHLVYHDYYKVVMDLLLIWGIAGAGMDMFFHGLVPLRWEMLILILDLPLFILLLIKYKSVHNLIFTRRWFYVLAIPLAFFLLYQGIFVFAESQNPGLLTKNQKITIHGTLGFSIVNRLIPDTAEILNENSESNEFQFDDTWYSLDGELPEEFINGPGFSVRRWFGNEDDKYYNFVCLQVESLQCGFEQIKHNGQYVMPYLHSLTKTALYYPYCFAYHVVGGTSDCEFSILNNVKPTINERLIAREYQHPNSIIKVLKKYKYLPLAFHNYYKDFYDRGSAFKRIGFDYFYDFYDMQITKPIWGNEDREMYEFILKNTEKWQPPFIYYIINLSSHPNFSHISRYHKVPFLADIDVIRDRDALTSFNYVDIQLEKFIASLKELYPDTWFFIYGDHSLAAVDFAGRLVRSSVTVGDDYLEFVPLIILAPDGRRGDFSDTLASLHDIGTTIISLLPRSASSRGYFAYPGFGGSLIYDNVEKMPIPFINTMYDRQELLKEIKALMEPYIDSD